MTNLRQPNATGIHHVYAREADRRTLFRANVDRREYLRLLGAGVVRMRWRCLSYCLMDTHAHVLVEAPDASLTDGIRRLHREYAAGVEARGGGLLRVRHGSKLVSSDEELWRTIAYIAWTPVKAGLVSSPEDWRWSSHGAAQHGSAPRWLNEERLLESFGGAGGDARRRYAELVSRPPR